MLDTFESQGFAMVSAWSDSISGMQSWLDTNGYRVTNNYQRDSTLFVIYRDLYWPGHTTIPTTYLIDRDGRVRAKSGYDGNLSNTWAPYINELL